MGDLVANFAEKAVVADGALLHDIFDAGPQQIALFRGELLGGDDDHGHGAPIVATAQLTQDFEAVRRAVRGRLAS